jgi:hypothetical protein
VSANVRWRLGQQSSMACVPTRAVTGTAAGQSTMMIAVPQRGSARQSLHAVLRRRPRRRHGWIANLLRMLWPEMDATFVTSGGGNPPPVTTRRPVAALSEISIQPAVPTAARAAPGRGSSHSR